MMDMVLLLSSLLFHTGGTVGSEQYFSSTMDTIGPVGFSDVIFEVWDRDDINRYVILRVGEIVNNDQKFALWINYETGCGM
jgi:hypothetical protein